MKLSYLRAALFAVAALCAAPALAQTVTQLPVYLDNSGVVYDFGNGPLEVRVIQGAAGIFTASGSGIGSGTTTAVTLTATPATPPCVGCILSGAGVTSGTLITAYNGTTGITTNTSQTIASTTALAWGAACPASGAGQRQMFIQPGQPVQADIPLYTQARICGVSQYNAGATIIPFAIGAH